MKSVDIQGSVAFVTGASRVHGIGRALVAAFLEHGASKVYATARKLSQLDDLVAIYGNKIVPVELDVTDLDAIEALPEKYSDVTVVVNNAGYSGMTSPFDDIETAQREIQVNYIAPMAIVKAFSPVLTKNSNSAVVNINSIASLVNFPIAGTYSASKAASHSLTQAQRRDLPKTLVLSVLPGPIDTDMAKEIEMEKETPATVAKRVMEALMNGIEDVYPDNTSENLFQGWKADAKALEKQMAASVSST